MTWRWLIPDDAVGPTRLEVLNDEWAGIAWVVAYWKAEIDAIHRRVLAHLAVLDERLVR